MAKSLGLGHDFRRAVAGFGKKTERAIAQKQEHVVAVGGVGFSGSFFAEQLLARYESVYRGSWELDRQFDDLRPKLRLVLIDKSMENMHGGEAYGAQSCDPGFYTNISPERLELRPSSQSSGFDSTMVVRWWDDIKYGSKTPYVEIPEDLQDYELFDQSVVPRRILQLYFRDSLYEQAGKMKTEGIDVTIDEVPGEVVEHSETRDGVSVAFDQVIDGQTKRVAFQADVFVASTGHKGFKAPGFVAPELAQDDGYVGHSYCPEGREKLDKIAAHSTPDSQTLIVGTGLSAYDQANYLLSHGYKGRITMESSDGFEHFQQKLDQPFKPLRLDDLPTPYFIELLRSAKAFSPGLLETKGAALAITRTMLNEFEDLTGMHIDIDPETLKVTGREQHAFNQYNQPYPYTTEQVLGAWGQYVPELGKILGAETVAGLLNKNASLIATMRAGVGYEVWKPIENAKDAGIITVVAGRVHDIAKDENSGKIAVRHTPKGQSTSITKNYDAVVTSAGLDSLDYTKTETLSTYWKNTIASGAAVVHGSGWGVKTSESGRLVRANGRVSERVFVAGVPNAGSRLFDNPATAQVGAPLIAIPGMRRPIMTAAFAAVSSLANINIAKKRSPEFGDDVAVHRQTEWRTERMFV